MGTQTVNNAAEPKKGQSVAADTGKKEKEPFKLTIVSKEELERLRIPVYPYLI